MNTLQPIAIQNLLKYFASAEGGEELFLHFFCQPRLERQCKIDHWLVARELLLAKEIIPDAWRIAAWFKWCYQSEHDIDPKDFPPEIITQYTALIDNSSIRLRYRQQKHADPHKYLHATDIDQQNPAKEIRWIFEEGVKTDDFPSFAIKFAMHGNPLRKDIIRILVSNNATNILLGLMKEQKDFFSCYPPREFLFLICANAQEEMGVAAIEHLMERFPHIFPDLADEFGNTPLWYLFHNQYANWWNPDSKIVNLLTQAGCNPHTVNHLDFSFQQIANSLTDRQRAKFQVNLECTLAGMPF